MSYERNLAAWGPASGNYNVGAQEFVLPPSAEVTAVTFSGLGKPLRVWQAMERKKQGRDNRKDRNLIKMYQRRPSRLPRGIKEGVVYYVTSVRPLRIEAVSQ